MRGLHRAVALALLAGCSVIADIDVCERQPSAEQAANARVEGDQDIRARALVPMPSGGAFAVFTSDVSADSNDGRSEVRGVLLDLEGAPGPTAGAGNEYTYGPSTSPPGSLDIHSVPMVVPPDVGEGLGVIVYNAIDETSSEIEAVFIGGSGAPFALDLGAATRTVSREGGRPCALARDGERAESRCASSARAVALTASSADPEVYRDFAFFWLSVDVPEFGVATTTVRGSLVRGRFGAQVPQPARDELEPGPVDLVVGTILTAIEAVSLGDGQTMLLWQESDVAGAGVIYSMILDRFLDEVRPRTEVARSELGLSQTAPLTAARSGDRIMAVWGELGAEGRSTLVMQRVAPNGGPVGATRAVWESAGVQNDPSITALSAREGYAVAWEATDDSGDDSASGGVRMVLLDEEGDPVFANGACGASVLQVNDLQDGRQWRPSLTTFADGSLMAAWTGRDISGQGIRARVWRPRELLPLE